LAAHYFLVAACKAAEADVISSDQRDVTGVRRSDNLFST
jgi:hypothetical protein